MDVYNKVFLQTDTLALLPSVKRQVSLSWALPDEVYAR